LDQLEKDIEAGNLKITAPRGNITEPVTTEKAVEHNATEVENPAA